MLHKTNQVVDSLTKLNLSLNSISRSSLHVYNILLNPIVVDISTISFFLFNQFPSFHSFSPQSKTICIRTRFATSYLNLSYTMRLIRLSITRKNLTYLQIVFLKFHYYVSDFPSNPIVTDIAYMPKIKVRDLLYHILS